MRSAFAREGHYHEEVFAPRVEWVLPERPLTQEIAAVLSAGYLKGADLWHLAAALYAVPEMGETTFITLDTRQRAIAQALAFQV